MSEVFIIWLVLLVGFCGGGLAGGVYVTKREREFARREFERYCNLQDKYFELRDEYRKLKLKSEETDKVGWRIVTKRHPEYEMIIDEVHVKRCYFAEGEWYLEDEVLAIFI